VLKKDSPIDTDFYVKCKRYDPKTDWPNRQNVRVIKNSRMTEFTLAAYQDDKKREYLLFSIESNHPMINSGIADLNL
jgi:hypothetical protein